MVNVHLMILVTVVFSVAINEVRMYTVVATFMVPLFRAVIIKVIYICSSYFTHMAFHVKMISSNNSHGPFTKPVWINFFHILNQCAYFENLDAHGGPNYWVLC